MLYWQGRKNFVEQIPIRFGGILRNQDKVGKNCAVDKQTNILVNIGGNLYIGRYTKGLDRYIGLFLVQILYFIKSA